MRALKTRSVFDHLGHASGADALLPHARRLLALKQMYQEIAPPMMAGVSRVMNLRLGQLVIAANNSAAATKLRQLEPRLKSEFLKRGVNINEIRVEVQAKPAVWLEWEKTLVKQGSSHVATGFEPLNRGPGRSRVLLRSPVL